MLRDEMYSIWKKDWFESGWDTGRQMKEVVLDELPEIEDISDEMEPYCWAELDLKASDVRLFIAGARDERISILKPKIVSPRVTHDSEIGVLTCNIAKCLVHFRDDEEIVIEVKVGDKPIKVPVFKKEDFTAAYQNDGCGVFGTEILKRNNRPLYTVSAIKEYYSAKTDRSTQGIKPAALDKFHRVWKIRFENLKKKPYISKYHIEELKSILAELSGAELLYVIYRLRSLSEHFLDSEFTAILDTEDRRAATKVFPSSQDLERWDIFTRKVKS